HESVLQSGLARLAAAREINERARRLLRDAAPVVAQHLCDRIASSAQQILARLHPEAAVLSWQAESYSLRLEPGERRFAMLSGGEQTKVALALTLAMIHEFTPLRFCVFDEPTYGVDAESRRRLAQTIVDLEDAARMDQILLVSHDDAFDGVIENVVLLRKSATSGTTPVPSV
ncbi:MAG: SMC family ATPase, partial [Verrucomicrobiales bacterium]|nr:SMC family ATPase [Verrucomicrobiales bacterium]